MGDIKIFQLSGSSFRELQGSSVELEKSLQSLIERNMESLLGVRFLASEHSTGKTHRGRIDTLGLDENHSPVIIEYKRATNQNVINQGLFYLNWLLDHKAEFELLVLKQFGKATSDRIDWSSPRLLCIANDFTKYDEHAVQQMNRSIELIRYRKFSDDLLLLELVNAVSAGDGSSDHTSTKTGSRKGRTADKTVTHALGKADRRLRDLFEKIRAYAVSLGDDVQEKALKNYIAFRRLKNFACVEVHNQAQKLSLFAKVDPKSITLEKGFTRDVSKIGHFGTGDLEITIRNANDFEKAKPLLDSSYEAS